MPLEKCPDKNATIEFSLKTTLVSANITGQETMTLGDDVSNGSGPESEFEFQDFLEENKNDIKNTIAKIRKQARKPPTILASKVFKKAITVVDTDKDDKA